MLHICYSVLEQVINQLSHENIYFWYLLYKLHYLEVNQRAIFQIGATSKLYNLIFFKDSNSSNEWACSCITTNHLILQCSTYNFHCSKFKLKPLLEHNFEKQKIHHLLDFFKKSKPINFSHTIYEKFSKYKNVYVYQMC